MSGHPAKTNHSAGIDLPGLLGSTTRTTNSTTGDPSMRASATLEVRTVPTCSDISENAHTLLTHLTRTRRGNKGTPVVKGDLDSWSSDLGLDREAVRLAFEEIGPEGDEFVQRDRHGRLVLWLSCACKKTDLPRKSSKEARRKATSHSTEGGVLNSLREYDPFRFAGQESNQDEDQSDPLVTFLNGASADDEVARPPAENAVTLASLFTGKVVASASRQGLRVMPGSVKQGALRAHFKTLLTGGVEPETIVSMIESFAANYRRYHKPGADPGVVFLAHRRRLFAEAEKRATLATERDINKLKKPGRKYATAADILGR